MGVFSLLYGSFSYLVFLGVFLYAIAFVGDLGVPRSVSVGPSGPVGTAVLVDLALLGVFALQHSVMARPGFKRVWTRLVPKSIERSTYVLLSSLALALLYWQWRPIAGTVWAVEAPAGRTILSVLFWAGWLLILFGSFLINHFDLFGLRQVWLRFASQPYVPLPFRTTALYAFVRHPLMLGFMIAFWAAPVMSWSRLLFAAAGTGYIVVGTALEERDLVGHYGAVYERYQSEVPRFVPWPGRRARESARGGGESASASSAKR